MGNKGFDHYTEFEIYDGTHMPFVDLVCFKEQLHTFYLIVIGSC